MYASVGNVRLRLGFITLVQQKLDITIASGPTNINDITRISSNFDETGV
jgi:hypothetical protein